MFSNGLLLLLDTILSASTQNGCQLRFFNLTISFLRSVNIICSIANRFLKTSSSISRCLPFVEPSLIPACKKWGSVNWFIWRTQRNSILYLYSHFSVNVFDFTLFTVPRTIQKRFLANIIVSFCSVFLRLKKMYIWISKTYHPFYFF